MTIFSTTLGLSLNDLIVATVEAYNVKGFGIPSPANTTG
jgi:hypothetical protein